MENKSIKGKYYSRDETIKTMMDRLTGDLSEHKIDVPEHQRNYVWKNSDATDLLKSLIYGYPISAITANKNEINSTIELQDGLQRNFSIRRLFIHGYKFIDKEILESFFPEIKFDKKKIKSHIKELDKIFVDENIEPLEFHSKILSLDPEVYSKRMEVDEKGKQKIKYKNFDAEINNSIKGVVEWITNDKLSDEELQNDNGINSMLSIKVTHIYLMNFEPEDVNDVFTLVNSKGKRLSTFERISAEWAKTPIKIVGNSDPISTFQQKRKNKYYNEIMIDERKNPNLVKYNDLNVTPSNYILSIISSSFSATIINDVFLDEFGNLRKNSEEAAVELIKYTFKRDLINIKKEDLGKALSEENVTFEEVNEQISKISDAYDLVTNQMNILRYGKGNSNKKYSLDIRAWFITVFILTASKNKSSDLTNFDDWFLYESVYVDNFTAGTKDYAKKAISKNYYLGKIWDFSEKHKSQSDLKKLMSNSLKEENASSPESEITKFAKIILGITQGKGIAFQTDVALEIDHLIPQETFKLYDVSKMNKNSLYNLNLLSKSDNSSKGDRLSSKTLDNDFVYGWICDKWKAGDDLITETDVQNYELAFETMLFNSYHYEVYKNNSKEIVIKEENGKLVKADKNNRNSQQLKEFLELRSEYFKHIITEAFPDWF